MMPILLAAAACGVILVADRSGFADRVEEELHASLPCVDVQRAFAPAPERTVVRIVSRGSVEIWERGKLETLLSLQASDDVDAVKIAEQRIFTPNAPKHESPGRVGQRVRREGVRVDDVPEAGGRHRHRRLPDRVHA